MKFILYLFFLFVTISCSIEEPEFEENLTPIEKLGKFIFFDTNLSEPAGLSCAKCHEPDNGFMGNNDSMLENPIGVAIGTHSNLIGIRNTPSVSYSGFSPEFDFDDEGAPSGGQFLDGRAASLVDQAAFPLLSVIEMNNSKNTQILSKIEASNYANLFQSVFGEDVFEETEEGLEKIGEALEAFQNSASVSPFSSKYDAYIQKQVSFTKEEEEGLKLFIDEKKGNCIACHVMDSNSTNPEDSLFTDFSYDNLGVPRNTKIPSNNNSSFFDLGLCGPQRTDLKTTNPELCGAFKVPTLRNTALKKAWMHNGFFTKLEDVVDFYVTRDTNPNKWYPAGNKFNDVPEQYKENVNITEIPYDKKPGEEPRLNETERQKIVTFLKTLTDGFKK